jgi:hypothetical protein
MGLFNKIFKSSRDKKDPYTNAPAFKQMMMELEKEENEFIERFEKMVPVIRPNLKDEDIASADSEEHKIKSSQPVSFPLDFDPDLSIFLGVENVNDYEWILNRQIEVAKDKIDPDKMVSKAFGNLFKIISSKIAVKMVTEDIGMIENCNSLESSLVVINEIWSLARKYVKGDDLIFAIPARDVFIFTRYGDDMALAQFREKLKEYGIDQSHPDKLSDKLYIKKKSGETEQLDL